MKYLCIEVYLRLNSINQFTFTQQTSTRIEHLITVPTSSEDVEVDSAMKSLNRSTSVNAMLFHL